MTRHRWFHAEWPISMYDLGSKFKNQLISNENVDGFVIDRIRENFIEARYIEKIEYQNTVIDPFGKELLFDNIEFKQSEFRVSSNGPGLELLNAPRGIQSLISRLLEAADFSLAISPLSIDVFEWIAVFQQLANINGIVDSVQIGGLTLEQGISAKTVIKGSKDVREACFNLVKDKKHNIEKLRLCLDGDYQGTILFTNIGSANINVKNSQDIINMVRDSLSQISS